MLAERCLTEASTAVAPHIIPQIATALTHTVINAYLVTKLQSSPLSGWPVVLRENELCKSWPPSVASALSTLEAKVSLTLVNQFLALFQKDFPGDLEKLKAVISNFNNELWVLDAAVLSKLVGVGDWDKWTEMFTKHTAEVKGKHRDISELIRILRADATNVSIESVLCPGQEDARCSLHVQIISINKMLGSRGCSNILQIYGGHNDDQVTYPSIENWSGETIKSWTSALNSKPSKERPEIIRTHLPEVIAVLSQALKLFKGYFPRVTQQLSLLLLLDAQEDRKGRLAEIATGEGKTIITAMLAIIQVLSGRDVDIITSSSVLAVENSKEMGPFYSIFSVGVGNICDKACDGNEDIRRNRYKNHVVYGDVSSFQRDLLLSRFFQKDIMKNRTAGVIIIDEVDSMLLDKGENILYLSHNIADLKAMRWIFMEIWQATHAPDIRFGRSEDVEKAKIFIRRRMQAGEISYPKHLQPFVESRLVTWIRNAYLAEFMTENDPYILADTDKEGRRIVIMDKDTGVEQTQTQWSNGLHQFLQLKHMDKLSPESLKAVFISNLSYFSQFQGKVFGISGTLGSEAERSLLSQCYNVDFFSMPRFKARKCVQMDGANGISPTSDGWIKSVINGVKRMVESDPVGGTPGRAVLVIAESIDTVLRISSRLKHVGVHGVYSYVSSFDGEFHKRNEERPLAPGDVIVATNLAGRGTDLKISPKLEEAGGLHVILIYMPTKERIEKQAFGRTARAGQRGTVEFILHADSNFTDEVATIAELRQIRDEAESQRLEKFRLKTLKQIQAEEKLSQRFSQLVDSVKATLRNRRPKVDDQLLELNIEFLTNRWAFWLDSMSESIKLISVTGDDALFEEFDSFEQTIESLVSSETVFNFSNGPTELAKLGRYYELKEKYAWAIRCFDKVIESDPDHSEISHYYIAASIFKLHGSSLVRKKKAIYHLKEADRILRKQIGHLLNSNQILEYTDQTRVQAGFGTLANRYSKQVQNEAQILQVYVGAIQEAVGQVVDPGLMASTAGIIDNDEGRQIFEILQQRPQIIKAHRLAKQIFVKDDKLFIRRSGKNQEIPWPSTFAYCKPKCLDFIQKRIKAERFVQEQDFKGMVLTKSEFYQLLETHHVTKESIKVKTWIVKATTEALENFKLPGELDIYRNPIKKLLKASSDQTYDGKTLKDLRLNEKQLSNVEALLKRHGILVASQTLKGKLEPTLKYNRNSDCIEGIPPTLDLYRDLIEAVVEMSTESGKSIQDYIVEENIPLCEDSAAATKQIWSFLNDAGVIKSCKVKFSLSDSRDKKTISKRLEEIENSLKSDKAMKELFGENHEFSKEEFDKYVGNIMDTLKNAVGSIKTNPGIRVSYEDLEKYFMSGEYPPEIEEFRQGIFSKVLLFSENKSWWNWEVFIVAMMGMAQVAFGVLLEVYTVGFGTHVAAGLISEGIGDIMFAIEAGIRRDFSWKAYMDHKVISVGFTILMGGVGAYVSRGAQAGRFTGKVGWSLCKAVGGRTIRKCAGAVGLSLLNMGVGKALDYAQEILLTNFGEQLKEVVGVDPITKEQLRKVGEKMETLFQKSYEDGQAKRLIEDAWGKTMKELSEGTIPQAVQLTSTVCSTAQGLVPALGQIADKVVAKAKEHADDKMFDKACKGMTSGAKTHQYLNYFETFLKTAMILKHVTDLASVAPSILNAFAYNLDAQIKAMEKAKKENHANDLKISAEAQKTFNAFKDGLLANTQREIISMLISKVRYNLVQPALQRLALRHMKSLTKAIMNESKRILGELTGSSGQRVQKLVDHREEEGSHRKESDSSKVSLQTLDPNLQVSNSDGLTVGEMKKIYGESKLIAYRDQQGNVYIETPPFDDYLSQCGNNQETDFFSLRMVSKLSNVELAIHDETMDLNPSSEDGVTRINAGNKKVAEVAYQKNPDGTTHMAPIVNGSVIQIPQSKDGTKNLCVYQTMVFFEALEKTGDVKSAIEAAASPENVKKYTERLVSFGRKSHEFRYLYEKGVQECARDFRPGAAALSAKSSITRDNRDLFINFGGAYEDVTEVSKWMLIEADHVIPVSAFKELGLDKDVMGAVSVEREDHKKLLTTGYRASAKASPPFRDYNDKLKELAKGNKWVEVTALALMQYQHTTDSNGVPLHTKYSKGLYTCTWLTSSTWDSSFQSMRQL